VLFPFTGESIRKSLHYRYVWLGRLRYRTAAAIEKRTTVTYGAV
jgi:hypothetical protein